MHLRSLVVCGLLLVAGACGDDGPSPDANTELPVHPADYAATYQEVRDCRFSLEHDMMPIRIVASPDAAPAYLARTDAVPAEGILVKEQFDPSDTSCAGPIVKWSVMKKVAAGTSAQTLDYGWQEVDNQRRVVTEDVQKCVNCHADCGRPAQGGFDGTCAPPPI